MNDSVHLPKTEEKGNYWEDDDISQGKALACKVRTCFLKEHKTT